MTLRASLALAALGLCAAPAQADQITYFAAQQSQSLDNAGAGARAMALGSAFVAVADDSSALAWNPAGLAGRDRDVVGLHHNAWLGGITQDSLALALKSNGWGGLGVSADDVDYGNFDQRDALGNITGSFSASRMGLALGWGGRLEGGLDLGGSVEGSRETLAGTTTDSVAGGLGFIYHAAPGLRLGGSYNHGGSAGGDALASGFFLGAAQQFHIHGLEGLVASGLEVEAAGVNRLQLGMEAGYGRFATFRAGYVVNFQPDAWQGLSGLTLGGGVGLGPVQMDYAWLPYGDLGASQRISLEYAFDGPNRPAAPTAAPAPVPSPLASPTAVPTPGPSPSPAMGPAPTAASPTARVDSSFSVLSDGYLLGQQLERAGQADQAAAAYRQAIQADPDDGPSWEALARYHARQGRLVDASACYAHALALDPSDDEAGAWLKAHPR
jgi:hypothetical protein